MTPCDHCPMAGVGDVPCAAVVTGHSPFCTSPDPRMPEAVRRLSYEMAGRAAPAAFPPLREQAANLAGAVGRFVASGLEAATAEERARRLAICEACPRFLGGRCKICGCRLRAKIAMASEHCPDDPPRW
jgi:hypothetical protein